MGQPFRLLVTGSRTWDDVRVIEQALAVILDRHPGGVLLVHGACPRGADAIAPPTPPGPRATAPRSIPPTGAGTGELPGTAAMPR